MERKEKLDEVFSSSPVVSMTVLKEHMDDQAIDFLAENDWIQVFTVQVEGEDVDLVYRITPSSLSLKDANSELEKAKALPSYSEAASKLQKLKKKRAVLSIGGSPSTSKRSPTVHSPHSPSMAKYGQMDVEDIIDTSESVSEALNGLQQKRMYLLHIYNSLKDLAENMLGVIAEKESIPAKALYTQYGL